MADNLNDVDLDHIISIVDQHYAGSPYGKDLLEKLQALRDTYWLYPDVWVSTVAFVQGAPVECRADVTHMTTEEFDAMGLGDE